MFTINLLFQILLVLSLGLAAIFFCFSLALGLDAKPKEKKDLVSNKVLFYALILGLAYNVFLFHLPTALHGSWYGIGLGLFGVLFFTFLYQILPAHKKRFFTFSLAALGALAGLATAFRANDFLIEFNNLAIEIAFLLLLLELAFEHIHWKGIWIIKNIPVFVQSFSVILLNYLKQRLTSKKIPTVDSWSWFEVPFWHWWFC
ncbi:hypothetical protein IPG41_06570 [Candidatus Peregrinibacteria bacterium]|nr:MAG: hypothetical protein IPG41_06570 [Candidatus Peregrinibacteria bacterium]